MLSILHWLLDDKDRPEYVLKPDLIANEGIMWELKATGRLLLLLVLARFSFNALMRAPTQRLAQRRGTDAHHRDGSRLLEELWVTAGNLVMLGAAMHVMMHKNGGCWFLDTSTCLAGWPNIGSDPAVRRYYQLELAWYLHMLLKPVLKYGLPDGRDMLIHHAASLALILLSYGTNLTRMGTVVLGIFAMSNPLLHIAKICNQLSLGPLKIGAFALFAAAFFLSRVLLVPLAVLKPALIDCRRSIPYAVNDFYPVYLFINALLAALYVMQLVWMRGIVRVLRSAARHGSAAASHMSARLDPAKRYAVAARPRRQSRHTANGAVADKYSPRPMTPSPTDLPTLLDTNGTLESHAASKNQ